MPKFNRQLAKTQQQMAQRGPNTLNRAGGLAYEDSPAMALYRQTATSLWSGDGYYEKHPAWLERFRANIAQVLETDAHFPFALAAYARDKRGLALRSTPLALYVEAIVQEAAKGTGYARQYAPKVLRRADEPAEAIAYFRKYHKGVVPHGLLRGIADVLPGFDEYQLAKYKDTGAVSLRDVFRLARPKPKDDEQRALWGRAVGRALTTPYTWEVELSKAKTDEEKREKWNELLRSGQLGLFALIRNIRNIVKYGADVEDALAQITQEKVRGSGILPFQWYKAYKAIAEASGEALAQPMQQALEWSLDEVPKLPGVTLVACDNSGSMSTSSLTRGMTHAELGNLMGALALYCCETGVAGTFGATFAIANTNPRHGLFYNKKQIDICGAGTGHSTDAWKIFEHLIAEKVQLDRVIIFSDMQCYDSHARHNKAYMGHSLSSELEAYQRINPNVAVYSVNLASQDNSCQFAPDQPVVELAGWSESIMHFIAAMEVGESVVGRIKEGY